MKNNGFPDLMWVTDRQRNSLPAAQLAEIVVAHGVNLVQIREKLLPTDDLRNVAREVVNAVGSRSAVVINSEPELAQELGIGVHLPEESSIDLGPHPFPLVGRSVHSPESAAQVTDADYLVAGHVYATSGKVHKEPIGSDGLAAIVSATQLPVFAIGGITPDSVPEILETGAHGIAVMSGIGSAHHPGDAASAYRQAIDLVKSRNAGVSSMPIHLTVNGKPVELHAPITVQEFLDSRKLHKNMVVVEHNGIILKRDQYPLIVLASEDTLEVVHFVGGG